MRPYQKLNAINMEMLEGLREATSRLRDRDDLRAMLVTANGKFFSAGIDLNSQLAPAPPLTSPSAFRHRQGRGSLQSLGDEWEAILARGSEMHVQSVCPRVSLRAFRPLGVQP
jgi:enoyl-CoA hydratase